MKITQKELEKMKAYLNENPIEGTWLTNEYMLWRSPQRIGQFRFDGEDWHRYFEVDVINGLPFSDTVLMLVFPRTTYGKVHWRDAEQILRKYSTYLPKKTRAVWSSDQFGFACYVYKRDKNCSPAEMRGMLKALIYMNNELVHNFENNIVA